LNDRTRAFLKVQDGCDYNCSFCTIPAARGKSRSDTIEHVVSNVKKLAASGAKEVVLTGINLGDFGPPDSRREDYKEPAVARKENFFSLINELDKMKEYNATVSHL
jgi:threonylcarbamoyladenosine tRNA methylthiotransferase MtaB